MRTGADNDLFFYLTIIFIDNPEKMCSNFLKVWQLQIKNYKEEKNTHEVFFFLRE